MHCVDVVFHKEKMTAAETPLTLTPASLRGPIFFREESLLGKLLDRVANILYLCVWPWTHPRDAVKGVFHFVAVVVVFVGESQLAPRHLRRSRSHGENVNFLKAASSLGLSDCSVPRVSSERGLSASKRRLHLPDGVTFRSKRSPLGELHQQSHLGGRGRKMKAMFSAGP